MPGDIVKILGIVKIVKIDKETMRLRTDIRTGSKLGLLYIDAVSVKKRHYKENDIEKYLISDTKNVTSEFTRKDINFIIEFTKETKGNQLK